MARNIPYRLGLDLGTSSIGWAAIKLTRSDRGKPTALLDAGVRIFEAGVEGDIEQGKDSSRATKRREARQPRRQNWRTQRRKQKLFELLGEFGLLPPSESSSSADRKACLDCLDKELQKKYVIHGDHDAHQKLTYTLRDKAAEIPLEAHEVGRALYALAQRRGYKSNRKGLDDEEAAGKVRQAITTLDKARGELTLAQHFSRNTRPTEARIRGQYLGRHQMVEEFDRIRMVQAPKLTLTEEQWELLKKCIFFQRPLKSQSNLIGHCDLINTERRCPECLPVFQEFRILQKVNDLQVLLPGQQKCSIKEFPDAREKLIEALNTTARLTANQAGKVAGLPKGAKFSLEEHEGLDLIGNRTNAKMLDVFGENWLTFPPEQQEQIILEVLHYIKPEKLKQRAQTAWGLDEEAAAKLARMRIEEDYARHCRKALEQLNEKMREGMPYSTARKECFPETFDRTEPVDILPPVKDWNNELANPAIIRALTELRKVINCLIAKYGKPAAIHIEVARDLKNSKKARKSIHEKNQQNRKRREKAVAEILRELKLDNPPRRDVEKWLLADECNWRCPYCSISFGAQELIGSHAEYNIEHIYPRRYLDDSYFNKTIACRSCNAKKGDLTPRQAFSGDQYERILAEVRQFKGSAREEKLHRFETAIPPEDFTSRHLNDTRYNARQAADYLATLYGGRYDAEGHMRILTPTGGLTWMLRTGWQLNDILSDSQEKTRDDHRHHAVDAIVVALSDQSRIKAAADAAEQVDKVHARTFLRSVEAPWNNFKDQIADLMNRMHVSHRPTRTISGPLHAESIYSKQHERNGNAEYRIRKELRKLSAKEILGDQIVDPAVRLLVQQKFHELGGKDPQKIFAEESNLPCLPNKNGPPIPIRKVRLAMNITPRQIGKGVRARNVASGKDSNFASLVYAVLDAQGNEKKWIHEIITRLEAAERYSENRKLVTTRGAEKVLIPDEQNGKRRFKFALRKNDMLLLTGPEGVDVLYRVQKLSIGEIQLCPHNLTRIEGKSRKPWNQIRNPNKLFELNARKTEISPIGEIVLHHK